MYSKHTSYGQNYGYGHGLGDGTYGSFRRRGSGYDTYGGCHAGRGYGRVFSYDGSGSGYGSGPGYGRGGGYGGSGIEGA